MVITTKRIEILKTDNLADYCNFEFRREQYSCYKGSCEICGNGVIDPSYVEIINKLKRANLLEKDYKLICCACYYIKKKIGFNYCRECGGTLKLIMSYQNCIRVYCADCYLFYREVK